MGFAKRILGEPRWPRRLHVLSTHEIWFPWKDTDIQAGWLDEIHFQALFASKMMVRSAVCDSSKGFSSLHLYIIGDVSNDLIRKL
jgi:hypothetical protein